MINDFSFSLQFKSINNHPFQNYSFTSGLHVIYGESNIGKSELVNLIANSKINSKSDFFTIENVSSITNAKVIHQNPDVQIISNTIENELVFSLECNSNNTKIIQGEFDKVKNYLLFKTDFGRHPSTLSGGEKELLNIASTLSSPTNILLIDDSLSFLSETKKDEVINQLFNKAMDSTIIMWFTSDSTDLKYSKNKWQLTKNNLSKINTPDSHILPKTTIKQGEIRLTISNLNFYYNKRHPIFTNYSTSIDQFRCLGIIGENGIGKSTLAAILTGIENPISGTINLTFTDNKHIELGYLNQFPEKLLGVMTLNEFIQLLIDNKKFEHPQFDEVTLDLLHFGISWNEYCDTIAMDLSWTTLRMALIVILSHCNYDLLILDEPTFGLGFEQKVKLLTYFCRYLAEKHLILISHDTDFIENLCDSTIKL